jgi:predicted acetyltransferase
MQVAQMYVNGYEQDYFQSQEFDVTKASATVELIRPTADMRVEFLTMAKEYLCFGDERYKDAIEDFNGYIQNLANWSQGRELPEGFVPSDTFWLVQNGSRILGCSRFRHSLTPQLAHEGGHIGYDIRPLQRHKGYGTLILSLTLEKARLGGLGRVLLVSDKNNIASAAIIQRNGGKFENEVTSALDGRMLARYWIDL